MADLPVAELASLDSGSLPCTKVQDLRQQLRVLEQDRDEQSFRASLLQRLVDAHVQGSAEWPERSAAGPPPKAHSPPCFQLQLPAEAASLPPFYRTLLLDWVADVSAAHESIKREVVTVDFAKVVMAKVHICNSIYQERQCPAAVECMNLFWRLTMSIIQGWAHEPKVMAAITDSLHLHNAAHSRGDLVLSHFRGLDYLRMTTAQAMGFAATARDYQEDKRTLRQQRSECLRKLCESPDAQAEPLSGCGQMTTMRTALEDQLLMLRRLEHRNLAKMAAIVLGHSGPLGIEGFLMLLQMGREGMCLNLDLTTRIMLDQVARRCTISPLAQARAVQHGVQSSPADAAPQAGSREPLQATALQAACGLSFGLPAAPSPAVLAEPGPAPKRRLDQQQQHTERPWLQAATLPWLGQHLTGPQAAAARSLRTDTALNPRAASLISALYDQQPGLLDGTRERHDAARPLTSGLGASAVWYESRGDGVRGDGSLHPAPTLLEDADKAAGPFDSLCPVLPPAAVAQAGQLLHVLQAPHACEPTVRYHEVRTPVIVRPRPVRIASDSSVAADLVLGSPR